MCRASGVIWARIHLAMADGSRDVDSHEVFHVMKCFSKGCSRGPPQVTKAKDGPRTYCGYWDHQKCGRASRFLLKWKLAFSNCEVQDSSFTFTDMSSNVSEKSMRAPFCTTYHLDFLSSALLSSCLQLGVIIFSISDLGFIGIWNTWFETKGRFPATGWRTWHCTSIIVQQYQGQTERSGVAEVQDWNTEVQQRCKPL